VGRPEYSADEFACGNGHPSEFLGSDPRDCELRRRFESE
jgi:hypothetical protein